MSDYVTSRQMRLVIALANCDTIAAAADAVGICVRTAYRYLETDAVRQAVRAHYTADFRLALAQMAQGHAESVTYLRRVVTGEDEGDKARLAAAATLLRHGQALEALLDGSDRLDAIEQLVKSLGV